MFLLVSLHVLVVCLNMLVGIKHDNYSLYNGHIIVYTFFLFKKKSVIYPFIIIIKPVHYNNYNNYNERVYLVSYIKGYNT